MVVMRAVIPQFGLLLHGVEIAPPSVLNTWELALTKVPTSGKFTNGPTSSVGGSATMHLCAAVLGA